MQITSKRLSQVRISVMVAATVYLGYYMSTWLAAPIEKIVMIDVSTVRQLVIATIIIVALVIVLFSEITEYRNTDSGSTDNGKNNRKPQPA
jgi:hypothetical protein